MYQFRRSYYTINTDNSDASDDNDDNDNTVNVVNVINTINNIITPPCYSSLEYSFRTAYISKEFFL